MPYRDAEKRRAAQRRYERKRRADPMWKLKNRLRVRVYDAVTKRGGCKSARTAVLLGASYTRVRQHLESQFKQGMTWTNYGKWHIDHIRPCAAFDLTCPRQQRQCFHYTNLQPLWAVDNMRKGSRVAPVRPPVA